MELFAKIVSDNVSGSGTILRKLQQEIINLLSAHPDFDTSELSNAIQKVLIRFPEFALLKHFSHAFSEIYGRK